MDGASFKYARYREKMYRKIDSRIFYFLLFTLLYFEDTDETLIDSFQSCSHKEEGSLLRFPSNGKHYVLGRVVGYQTVNFWMDGIGVHAGTTSG